MSKPDKPDFGQTIENIKTQFPLWPILAALIGALLSIIVGLGAWALSGVSDSKQQTSLNEQNIGFLYQHIHRLEKQLESYSFNILTNDTRTEEAHDRLDEIEVIFSGIKWRLQRIEHSQSKFKGNTTSPPIHQNILIEGHPERHPSDPNP